MSGWVSSQPSALQLVVALAACAVVLIIKYWNRGIGSPAVPRQVKPFPGALPLLGNIMFVALHSKTFIPSILKQWAANAQKTFCLTMPFNRLMLFTCDYRDYEHVTKTKFENYVKGEFYKKRLGDGLGNGIFNTDGHSWWLQRKAVSRIFSEAAFNRFMEEVFTQKMVLLKRRLHEAAASGTPIDLHALLHRYTFDSFCNLALGFNVDSLSTEGDVPFMHAFDRMQRRMVTRFLWPAWELIERISGLGRQMAEDVKLIRGTCAKLVREKLEKAKNSDTTGMRDLIALVIDLSQTEPDSKEYLNEEFLVDVVVNLLLAGRDTTAQSLAWSLYGLMQSPEATEKLLNEVQEVCGLKEGDVASYQEVKKLKYTSSVFLESNRLHTPVPTISKLALKPDVLPSGVPVPAGAVVVLGVCGVARHPELWGPDADSFKPERWLDMDVQPAAAKYPIFHAGPRICVGRHMAQLEATYVLAELTSHFVFKLVDGHPVVPDTSLTLPMRYGLKVHVMPRKRN